MFSRCSGYENGYRDAKINRTSLTLNVEQNVFELAYHCLGRKREEVYTLAARLPNA